MTRCRAVIGPPAPRRPHQLGGVAVGGAPVVVDGSIPRLVVPEADTSAMIDIDSVQNGEYTTCTEMISTKNTKAEATKLVDESIP